MTDWPPTWHVDSQMWVNSRVEPGGRLLRWAKPVDLGNFHTNVPDEYFEGNTPEEAHGFYTYVPAQGSWSSSGHVRVWHDPDNARWRSSSQTPHDQGHWGPWGWHEPGQGWYRCEPVQERLKLLLNHLAPQTLTGICTGERAPKKGGKKREGWKEEGSQRLSIWGLKPKCWIRQQSSRCGCYTKEPEDWLLLKAVRSWIKSQMTWSNSKTEKLKSFRAWRRPVVKAPLAQSQRGPVPQGLLLGVSAGLPQCLHKAKKKPKEHQQVVLRQVLWLTQQHQLLLMVMGRMTLQWTKCLTGVLLSLKKAANQERVKVGQGIEEGKKKDGH